MKWRDTDLSAEGAELVYRGRIYARPAGRGVLLEELELRPQLEELLDSGYYEAEIKIVRKLPATDQS